MSLLPNGKILQHNNNLYQSNLLRLLTQADYNTLNNAITSQAGSSKAKLYKYSGTSKFPNSSFTITRGTGKTINVSAKNIPSYTSYCIILYESTFSGNVNTQTTDMDYTPWISFNTFNNSYSAERIPTTYTVGIKLTGSILLLSNYHGLSFEYATSNQASILWREFSALPQPSISLNFSTSSRTTQTIQPNIDVNYSYISLYY